LHPTTLQQVKPPAYINALQERHRVENFYEKIKRMRRVAMPLLSSADIVSNAGNKPKCMRSESRDDLVHCFATCQAGKSDAPTSTDYGKVFMIEAQK